MLFFPQFVRRGGKKNSNISYFERVPRTQMLREGRKEGKKDTKDSEKARISTTECVLTTSIWRHQHRLSCCIHAPARYVLGIRETLAARVVRRVQQSVFLRRFRFVSCVRTQVHMTSCLFVLIRYERSYLKLYCFSCVFSSHFCFSIHFFSSEKKKATSGGSTTLLKLFITKFSIIKTPRTSSCEFLCIREKISSKNFGEQPCPNGEPLGHSVLRVEYGLLTKAPAGPPWVTFPWTRQKLGTVCK